jgi:hypothetical protein
MSSGGFIVGCSVAARGRHLEHGVLGVRAVPALSAAAAPTRPWLVAVEDRLVAVVVVTAPEDEGVLDPDEGLAQLPTRRLEAAAEDERLRTGRVGDIQRRAGPEGGVGGGKGLREKLLEALGPVTGDPQLALGLADVVDTVRRIGP